MISCPDNDHLNNAFICLLDNKHEWEIKFGTEPGTNILGLVVFSTVLGITLGKMGGSGKPLLNFFETLSTAMMIITNWVVWCVHMPR